MHYYYYYYYYYKHNYHNHFYQFINISISWKEILSTWNLWDLIYVSRCHHALRDWLIKQCFIKWHTGMPMIYYGTKFPISGRCHPLLSPLLSLRKSTELSKLLPQTPNFLCQDKYFSNFSKTILSYIFLRALC